MEIKIKRTYRTSRVIDGELSVNGQKICDTTENGTVYLQSGCYHISLRFCKHFNQYMPAIGQAGCKKCSDVENFTPSSVLPRRCPMLRNGNGAYGCTDGSILLGTRVVTGCVKNSLQSFNRVLELIKREQRDNKKISLIIEDQLYYEKRDR